MNIPEGNEIDRLTHFLNRDFVVVCLKDSGCLQSISELFLECFQHHPQFLNGELSDSVVLSGEGFVLVQPELPYEPACVNIGVVFMLQIAVSTLTVGVQSVPTGRVSPTAEQMPSLKILSRATDDASLVSLSDVETEGFVKFVPQQDSL